jgi:hypothetical protein
LLSFFISITAKKAGGDADTANGKRNSLKDGTFFFFFPLLKKILKSLSAMSFLRSYQIAFRSLILDRDVTVASCH